MDVCYKLQDRAPGKALKLGNGCRKIKHFPGIYCSSWTRWKNGKTAKLKTSTFYFQFPLSTRKAKSSNFETFSKFQTNFALHYTLPASHTKILMSMRYVHACHVERCQGTFHTTNTFFWTPCIGILHFQAKREEKTRNKNLILREKMRLMEIIWPRIRRENNKMGYNFHFVKIKKMRL